MISANFWGDRKLFGKHFAMDTNINADDKYDRIELDDLILKCFEPDLVLTAREIAEKVAEAAQGSGKRKYSDGTILYHLNKHLVSNGKVKHQKQGYLIESIWKEGQPKAFIFVELHTPKKKGENYQKALVGELRNGFQKREYANLHLISIDEIIGAEFSVIVQVYSENIHFIGRFVKEYLITSRLVKMTRTLMVCPAEPVSENH